MKNRFKSAEEAKAEHFAVCCCMCFQCQKRHDKAISVGGSNNNGSNNAPGHAFRGAYPQLPPFATPPS